MNLYELGLLCLPGVGPVRADRLEAIGLRSVRDLLVHVPRALDIWPEPTPIGALESDSDCDYRVHGEVWRSSLRRFGKRSSLRVWIRDQLGDELEVAFFNQPWLAERMLRGVEIEVRGRFAGGSVPVPASRAIGAAAANQERQARKASKGRSFVVSRLGKPGKPLPPPGCLIPVYSGVEGFSSDSMAKLIETARAEYGAALKDPLDSEWLREQDLQPLHAEGDDSGAVAELHGPNSEAAWQRARARVRLEPLLELQASAALRRSQLADLKGRPIVVTDEQRESILSAFPFEWTPAQRAVLEELEQDLGSGRPMRRLLQGDVGSGKTVIGMFACIAAIRASAPKEADQKSSQAAFMAPTEILAEQHYRGQRAFLERCGVSSCLLTGSMRAAERRAVETDIREGRVQLVFGTHALFSQRTEFADLSLAVIDEQHRFGVRQRQRLVDKGGSAHVLLMTATPIPRSLAQTLYGDLDVSQLLEKPPGRQPIQTRWLRSGTRRSLLTEMAERFERGERVFWVCPRIDEDDEDKEGAAKSKANISAQARYDKLCESELADYGVELVHGRLDAQLRAERLERFRVGEVHLLVATTVIEVGVDVPEATVMVIEGAERLGLAQLHQLRGRVGRGALPGFCYLVGKRSAGERLELLERETDGFALAEADLMQRGMGDLLGLRQAGANAEGLDDPGVGIPLLRQVREICERDPSVLATYGVFSKAWDAQI